MARMQSGQFEGKLMRFALICAQSPSVGRKSSGKDRRPLSAVPIARLRCWEVLEDGREVMVDPNSMRLTNLICRIELRAPVCPASLDIQSTSTSSTSDPLSLLGSTDFPSTYPLASSIPQHATGSLLDSHAPDSFLRSIMPNIDTTETASTPLSPDSDPQAFQFSASSSSLPPSTSPQRRNHTRSHRLPSPPERSTVEPLAESESASDSTVTGKVSVPSRNLFGNLFVQAVRLMDLEDKLGIWFIYPDIVVRVEGDYSLKFHVFDVDPDSNEPSPILASCDSDPFTVFGVRLHPGVPTSTPLAKHFVSQGFSMTLKKGKEK